MSQTIWSKCCQHFVPMHLEFATSLLVGEVLGISANAYPAIAGVQCVDLELGHDGIFASLQANLAQEKGYIWE